MKNKTRYTVDFPDKVMDLLTTLSVNNSVSKADILRQSIALFSYVNKEEMKGNTLSITKDSKIIKDIVIIGSRK